MFCVMLYMVLVVVVVTLQSTRSALVLSCSQESWKEMYQQRCFYVRQNNRIQGGFSHSAFRLFLLRCDLK